MYNMYVFEVGVNEPLYDIPSNAFCHPGMFFVGDAILVKEGHYQIVERRWAFNEGKAAFVLLVRAEKE